jgi:hypothetical protein
MGSPLQFANQRSWGQEEMKQRALALHLIWRLEGLRYNKKAAQIMGGSLS